MPLIPDDEQSAAFRSLKPRWRTLYDRDLTTMVFPSQAYEDYV